MDDEIEVVAIIAVQEIANTLFLSSSEEESEDDTFEGPRKKVQRIEKYMEDIVSQYTSKQFQQHFRMLPMTVDYILKFIEPQLTRSKPGNLTIPPKKQLLIALWKMATPDSYRSICEKFDVSKSTALQCVRKVVRALVKLAPEIIVWPNEEKATSIFQGFQLVKGFPKVIGAIDGTHIRIPAPQIDSESYVNRKGYHSIQLQAVCDHRGRFTYCYADNAGSVHDQRVFRLSELKNYYLEDVVKFPQNCHMIGDSAYTLHNHLLVPYRDNGHLTEKQKNYNFCHSATRMVIERAFGLLKGRFRSLLTVLNMREIQEIPHFIMACCVLHNICIMQNDQLDDEDFLQPPEPPQVHKLGQHMVPNQQLAIDKRNIICEELRMAN